MLEQCQVFHNGIDLVAIEGECFFKLVEDAHEIQHEELGNLSVGSPADVAVLRLEKGKFGFTDQIGARLDGSQKLVAELTMRDGKVVWDFNGMTRETWDKIPAGGRGGDPRWDSFTSAGRGGANAKGGDQKKQ